MGGMASAAGNDISIGLGLKENVGGRHSGFSRRTEARKAREQDAIDNFQLYKEDDKPRQSAPPRAAPAPNYNIGAVAAAPSVPDPDAIGETEQALLDAQKKGRSSTIATSSRGLLSGDDSTSKKRSLMGSLIT